MIEFYQVVEHREFGRHFSDRNERDNLVTRWMMDIEMKIHEPRTIEFTLGSETPVKAQNFPHQALIGAHFTDYPFFVATPVVSHASVFSLGSSYHISLICF
jgi:hypothetical protein